MVVADGREQEPGMAGDLLVVAELDDEVAVAVAEVVQLALIQEGFDHDVTERLDKSHDSRFSLYPGAGREAFAGGVGWPGPSGSGPDPEEGRRPTSTPLESLAVTGARGARKSPTAPRRPIWS